MILSPTANAASPAPITNVRVVGYDAEWGGYDSSIDPASRTWNTGWFEGASSTGVASARERNALLDAVAGLQELKPSRERELNPLDYEVIVRVETTDGRTTYTSPRDASVDPRLQAVVDAMADIRSDD